MDLRDRNSETHYNAGLKVLAIFYLDEIIQSIFFY